MKNELHCCLCKKFKSKEEFYADSTNWRKYHSRCKECDKKRSKSRREYFKKYMKEDKLKNPQKWAARLLARTKLKKLPCEVCGSKKSEAHHPVYSKPLDVKWLCHAHHWQLETGRII